MGLVLAGCCTNKKHFRSFDLQGKVWIYDSPTMPDSIKNFTDNFLIFDSTNVRMNNANIGEYTLVNDTLRIFQTSYLQKGNTFQKKVSGQFVGVIIQLNARHILIQRISGYFPLKYKYYTGNFDNSKIIRLTNQRYKKKKNVHFEFISIASSECYGTCPAYNLEVYKSGFVKFHGSSYCKKLGDYTGRIPSSELRKIEECISYLNLKNDSTILPTPIDAPEAVVTLKVNNKEYYFYGFPGEFQNKMQELMQELFSIAEKTVLKKTKAKLRFKVDLKVPLPEQRLNLTYPK